jgi:hypothetical protein
MELWFLAIIIAGLTSGFFGDIREVSKKKRMEEFY